MKPKPVIVLDMSSNIVKPANEFAPSVYDKYYPDESLPMPGTPTHWKKLPFRFYPSELSIWTGINGHGKTLFLNQLSLDFAICGERTYSMSLEMPPEKSIYRISRQALANPKPDEDDLLACIGWLGSKMYFYPKIGTTDIRHIIESSTEAIEKYGVRHIVIDSFMKCGVSSDDNAAQAAFIGKIQDFAQSHKVHVHLVAHAKKLLSEEEHPGKMDVKGASEITNMADNVFSIWRNKKKERQVQEFFDTNTLPRGVKDFSELRKQYDCVVECSKHREMGSDGEGAFGLYYHKASFQFIENLDKGPEIYWSGNEGMVYGQG